MQNVIIMAQYEINKDYIAKVLCENKDRPVMRCYGKCQLSKKLKMADEKQSQNKSLLEKFSFQSPAIIPEPAFAEFPELFIIYNLNPPAPLSEGLLIALIIPPDPVATSRAFYS